MIMNQIIACCMLVFMEAGMIFGTVKTKETPFIIVSVILGVVTILFILQAIKVIKKEKGIKVKHDINYTTYIILIIICTFFSVCFYFLIKNVNYRRNGIETNAVVYQVDKNTEYKTEYDEDGNSYEKEEEHCDVYIEYEVKNIKYNNKLDLSSCNYEEGEKVKIYYQEDDPNKFVNGSTSGLLALIVATILTGGILLLIIYKLIKGEAGIKRKKK